MYKHAFLNQQRRVDFIAPADLAGGEETLTPFQRLGDMKRASTNLQQRIVALPKGSEERAVLCREFEALNREIQDFKLTIPKAPRQVADAFVNEAKRILPRGQFDAIWRAAVAECDRLNAETGP